MANELVVKNGFISKGNSTVDGIMSGTTFKNNTIDTSVRILYASDLTATVDWESTQLVGIGGSVNLDWTQGIIKDSGPLLSIDWNNRILYDNLEIGVLDWQNKIMSGMTTVQVDSLVVDTPYVPTGSTDPTGSVGTISWSGNSLYVKNSTEWVKFTGLTSW